MSNLAEKLNAVKSYLKNAAKPDPKSPKKQTARFFETPQYPVQLKDPSDATYATDPKYLGELRGFYPNHSLGLPQAFFQPYNSMYHEDYVFVEGVDWHRDHIGVDIYAPYFPFPHEVPIFALAAGELTRIWTLHRKLSGGDYEGYGNRIRHLFYVPHEGERLKCEFLYGHLERLGPGIDSNVRDSRHPSDKRPKLKYTVKAGDLIGFAGKTGNADHHKECSTLEASFKANAGHVHLGFYLDGKSQDPLSVLPKPLAYNPVNKELGLSPAAKEKYQRPLITNWPSTATKLRAKQEMPEVPAGRLKPDWTSPLRRRRIERENGKPTFKRALLPSPVTALDFDHSASLQDTLDAYFALKASNAADITRAYKTHKSWFTQTGAPDVKIWDETLAAYFHRANGHLNSLKISPDQNNLVVQPKNAGHLILSLMHLYEAFWVLLGGPAFQSAAKGKMQPSCGAAVYGHLRAVAYHHAVAGLHHTEFEIGGTKRWSLSISFGSGSLRHAVLTQTATETADADLKPFLSALEPLLVSSQLGFDRAYRNYSKIRMGDTAAITKVKRAIDEALTDAKQIGGIAQAWNKATFAKFLKLMAKENLKAIEVAETIAAGAEPTKQTPFSPFAKWISLDTSTGKSGGGST